MHRETTPDSAGAMIIQITETDLADLVATSVQRALSGMQRLTDKQAADVALAAAKAAVQQHSERMFSMLGVNVSDAKEMAQFASDVEFLRAMHSNAGAMGRRATMFLLTAFLGGMVLAVIAGIKVLLSHPS